MVRNILQIYTLRGFYWLPALIEEQNYEDTAVALEVEIIQIPRDDFQNLVYGDIELSGIKRLLNLAYSSLRKEWQSIGRHQ